MRFKCANIECFNSSKSYSNTSQNTLNLLHHTCFNSSKSYSNNFILFYTLRNLFVSTLLRATQTIAGIKLPASSLSGFNSSKSYSNRFPISANTQFKPGFNSSKSYSNCSFCILPLFYALVSTLLRATQTIFFISIKKPEFTVSTLLRATQTYAHSSSSSSSG